MITGSVKFIVAMIGIFWMAIAGTGGMYWWDRRPPHVPSVHVLFWTWSPKDSLGAQLADSAQRLKDERANVVVLQRAIDGQNAAIKHQADVSADALADAEDAIRAARAPAAKAAQSRVVVAAAATVGPTACDRAQSVDKAFVGSLK